MLIEQNKALVRKFADCIDTKDLDAALTLVSPDFVDHTPPAGLPLVEARAVRAKKKPKTTRKKTAKKG